VQTRGWGEFELVAELNNGAIVNMSGVKLNRHFILGRRGEKMGEVMSRIMNHG
jgi:hypothetical protein